MAEPAEDGGTNLYGRPNGLDLSARLPFYFFYSSAPATNIDIPTKICKEKNQILCRFLPCSDPDLRDGVRRGRGLDAVGADDADRTVHVGGGEEVAQAQIWDEFCCTNY